MKKECRPTVFINASEREKLTETVAALLPAETFAPTPRGVRIFGEVRLNDLLGSIIQAGIEIDSVNCHESSIEDYYLALIGGARHV